MCLQYKSFENTVGKGQIAKGSSYPFPTVFSARLEIFLPFLLNLKLSSAKIFSLEESKICCLRKNKEVTHYTEEQNYNRVAKRNKGAYDNLKWVLK